MSIDKNTARDESEDEPAQSGSGQDGGNTATRTPEQPPKRKGGRKPLYSTTEERKQRNRQAQAAFRERRTDYIKQLEDNIRIHEANTASLQAAHRIAAEEVLVLRYKNSLLERILLEKQIDVQAELRAKSPNLGSTPMPQILRPARPERHPRPRHQSRRSTSRIPSRLELAARSLPSPVGLQATPTINTTSSPHAASPTDPGLRGPSVSSPSSDHLGLRPGPVLVPPIRPSMAPMQGPMGHAAAQHQQQHQQQQQQNMVQAGNEVGPNTYYGQSGFQPQMEQLEQEYEISNQLMSGVDAQMGGVDAQMGGVDAQMGGVDAQPMNSYSSFLDGHQQGPPAQVDWRVDPFGLDASMNFPVNQFSGFDTSNLR